MKIIERYGPGVLICPRNWPLLVTVSTKSTTFEIILIRTVPIYLAQVDWF